LLTHDSAASNGLHMSSPQVRRYCAWPVRCTTWFPLCVASRLLCFCALGILCGPAYRVMYSTSPGGPTSNGRPIKLFRWTSDIPNVIQETRTRSFTFLFFRLTRISAAIPRRVQISSGIRRAIRVSSRRVWTRKYIQ